MSDQVSAGLIKGKVIEQRAKLRRNLVSRLFRLGNAIQTQTQQLLSLTSDLSVVQFRILLRLRQAGTQNVQGISELLGANRSLVSRALPELRDRGWVTLIKSEEDKRQIFVRLTDAGRQVVDDHYGPLRARSEAMRNACGNGIYIFQNSGIFGPNNVCAGFTFDVVATQGISHKLSLVNVRTSYSKVG